jgi:hypothetical protein
MFILEFLYYNFCLEVYFCFDSGYFKILQIQKKIQFQALNIIYFKFEKKTIVK